MRSGGARGMGFGRESVSSTVLRSDQLWGFGIYHRSTPNWWCEHERSARGLMEVGSDTCGAEVEGGRDKLAINFKEVMIFRNWNKGCEGARRTFQALEGELLGPWRTSEQRVLKIHSDWKKWQCWLQWWTSSQVWGAYPTCCDAFSQSNIFSAVNAEPESFPISSDLA